MSERLNTPENFEAPQDNGERIEVHRHKTEKAPEKHQPAKETAEARRKIQEAGLESDEIKAKAEQTHKPHHPKTPVTKESKQLVYQRTLLKTRRRLSPVSRVASKVIHQPAIEAVSEAASKTVARPSGLLGGGLVAFLGTAAYYWMSRHYGYVYKNSVFLVLLIGGFLLGWFLEGIFKTFRRSS